VHAHQSTPIAQRLIGGLIFAALTWLALGPAQADVLRKRAAAAPAASPAAQGKALQVGTLALTPCGQAWCGSLTRALDPSGEVPGTIAIAFELYPQRDAARPNAGAVVATEGGPGYATTGSRAGYLALFDPLLTDRHLLLVDNRGTGRSAPLHCEALQYDPLSLPQSVAACGAQLGERAALYGSALAADDLAAVIDALQLGRVDLYGDSYGTFFSQTFAGRHPALLRSVVLDAAYAVIGADPWYPEAAPQARAAFDAACARSPACAALGGASMDRVTALLQTLRAAPVTGTAPDGDGTLQTAIADAQGLAYVMFANASGPVVYRELDAAARAWATGDTAPLLRLVAENQTVADSTAAADRARAFSAGLFTAVSCADYTQIYRMTDAPLARRRASGASVMR
jgi:pimeloyl-ACP methyl ester carboxylesterase